jgi:hypothetical protein
MPYDIEYGEPGVVDDTSTWTVTAALVVNGTGIEVLPAPVVEQIALTQWRAHVTKEHTTLLRGTRATLRIVATDPLIPSEPDVETADIVVTRI